MRNQTLTLLLTAFVAACSGESSGTAPADTSAGSGSGDTGSSTDTGSTGSGADTGSTDTGSEADGSGEGSAQPLLPSLRLRGPHTFATTSDELVDETRPFPAGSGEVAEPRRLPVTIWHPTDAAAPGPVIIWAHGLGSTRSDNRKTAEILASRGYIVAAADFPKTNRLAQPPDVADVLNQPGDLKLLADRVLALGATAGSPLEGRVDTEKMAYVGLSLGAMTVMLAAWQTEFYDPASMPWSPSRRPPATCRGRSSRPRPCRRSSCSGRGTPSSTTPPASPRLRRFLRRRSLSLSNGEATPPLPMW
ncbi:MAG: hypothetical protein HQ461_09040 [Deltaproteobacteria bacterium]|nr:hypothetical protein [Deltaproteobacteria bacterium]